MSPSQFSSSCKSLDSSLQPLSHVQRVNQLANVRLSLLLAISSWGHAGDFALRIDLSSVPEHSEHSIISPCHVIVCISGIFQGSESPAAPDLLRSDRKAWSAQTLWHEFSPEIRKTLQKLKCLWL